MTYNAHKRNIIGTLGFFLLGVLIGGCSPAIAVWREWQQYRKNGTLENGDLMRYVFVGSVGAMIQLIVLIILIIKLWLN